ncbi:MAG: lytic transglycosylase domain-containing protein [Blastocatellia bacterium]
MSRILVIVALIALFDLLVFSTPAGAQSPTHPSRQVAETANVKNVASLTTTDLLNTQDFAPAVKEAPATRSRVVNVSTKNAVNNQPAEREGLKGKKGMSPTSEGQAGTVAAVADVMRPAVLPAPPSAEVETAPRINAAPQRISTGNGTVDELVTQSAQRNGVDPRLIFAVMQQESGFNPRATSYKGARGLMQLMPATAARFGVTDIYDPAQNIEGGARYLRFLLDTFRGDVELALAGYNAGEYAVIRSGNRIPPYRETQDYVRRISAHYERLQNGAPMRRIASVSTAPAASGRKAEGGILAVGATMTEY